MKLTNNSSVLNRLYLGLALLWTAIVAVLCLIRMDELPMPKLEKDFDKFGHMAFHFGITALWFFYFNYKSVNTRKAFFKAFSFSFFYGISLELAQALFTNTRDADVLDVAANSAGALLAVIIVIAYNKLFSKEKFNLDRI